MPVAFPLELVDWVIDHLYDDKSSLRRCALVSRSWLNTSRYHLFRTLIVRPRRENTAAGQEFTAFRSFLRDTPHISFHIRELGLGDAHHPLGHGLAQLCKHALCDILRHTPNLLRLWFFTIGLADCGEQCDNLMYYSEAAPFDLTELSFVSEFVLDIKPFIGTLRLFGHVGVLRFRTQFSGHRDTAIATIRCLSRIPMSLQVHEFVNGPASDEMIYDVLILFRSIGTLSSFFFLSPILLTGSVSQFIAAAGSTLCHFSMNFAFLRPRSLRAGESSTSIKHSRIASLYIL